MIYIDTPTSKGWSHMIGDTIEELHEFAKKVGLRKSYYQNKKKKDKIEPHYDVRISRYREMIEAGAKPITRAELLTILRLRYGPFDC